MSWIWIELSGCTHTFSTFKNQAPWPRSLSRPKFLCRILRTWHTAPAPGYSNGFMAQKCSKSRCVWKWGIPPTSSNYGYLGNRWSYNQRIYSWWPGGTLFSHPSGHLASGNVVNVENHRWWLGQFPIAGHFWSIICQTFHQVGGNDFQVRFKNPPTHPPGLRIFWHAWHLLRPLKQISQWVSGTAHWTPLEISPLVVHTSTHPPYNPNPQSPAWHLKTTSLWGKLGI